MTDAQAVEQELPKILFVDDEEENLRYLRRVFRKRFQVHIATSGSQALALIKEHRFSVIVSDQRMPGMTGVELLQRALEISPDTIRLILTGFSDLTATIDAVNLGRVSGFLKKPIDPAEVQQAVDSSLEMYNLMVQNRSLLNSLAQRTQELEERERLLQMSLDDRTRELLTSNRRLEEAVIRDGLTGLYNHRYFQQRADEEIKRSARHGGPVSLIFCDIDHFKVYNDTHGHPAGDQLLMRVSDILRSGSGASDAQARIRETDIVARYGGEEFVVLLPETPKEGGRILAERIRRTIESHDFPGGDKQPGGHLTVSLGVSSMPEDASDKAELIQRADEALYRAKAAGRNRVCLAEPA